MAVRSFGDTAVLDFVEQTASNPHGLFVIDVWRGSDESWKLAVRYLSETEVREVKQSAKPTGKE